MITPRLISPILDGFSMGLPFDQHGASLCFQATEEASGETFIVKTISVPTFTVEMDAMLVTGAFSNVDEANAYYKEQARDILKEAKNLRYLTALGGFVDFDSVQVVSSPEGKGYEVYLLSPQRTSLQKMLKENVTQQELLRMAMDICSALSACRHAGFFYANLKPGNVFRCEQHYRIGDLGFIPLLTLHKTILPEKYRSVYTPPEMQDPDSRMNDTADIYALGMMLYEAYNGGVLPTQEDVVGQLYAPPCHADYELAEIILRACAIDPAIRWHDPEQMSLAISRYLRRNGLRNTTIIPPSCEKMQQLVPSVVEDFLPESEEIPDFSQIPEDFPLPAVEKITPPPRRRPQKQPKRRIWPIIIAILVGILTIELLIAAFLLH